MYQRIRKMKNSELEIFICKLKRYRTQFLRTIVAFLLIAAFLLISLFIGFKVYELTPGEDIGFPLGDLMMLALYGLMGITVEMFVGFCIYLIYKFLKCFSMLWEYRKRGQHQR